MPCLIRSIQTQCMVFLTVLIRKPPPARRPRALGCYLFHYPVYPAMTGESVETSYLRPRRCGTRLYYTRPKTNHVIPAPEPGSIVQVNTHRHIKWILRSSRKITTQEKQRGYPQDSKPEGQRGSPLTPRHDRLYPLSAPKGRKSAPETSFIYP